MLANYQCLEFKGALNYGTQPRQLMGIMVEILTVKQIFSMMVLIWKNEKWFRKEWILKGVGISEVSIRYIVLEIFLLDVIEALILVGCNCFYSAYFLR